MQTSRAFASDSTTQIGVGGAATQKRSTGVSSNRLLRTRGTGANVSLSPDESV